MPDDARRDSAPALPAAALPFCPMMR